MNTFQFDLHAEPAPLRRSTLLGHGVGDAGTGMASALVSIYGLPARYQCGVRTAQAAPPWRRVAWLQMVNDADLHLASVAISKIQAGIELSRDHDPTKAAEIEQWLNRVRDTFNILAMDGPAYRCWAQLMHRQSDTLYEDAMIAAIARVHQLTVVTRNLNNFSRFDIPLLNPFSVGLSPG